MKLPIVFSDFDGTITEKDVIISIMEHFAPPQWKKIHSDLMKGKIDVDVGIKKMFNLLQSEKKEEIINWCKKNVKIREGFKDFLLYLKEKNIPFIVLSGGLDFYINSILEPYENLISKIYSNKAIFTKKFIDVEFIYRCDDLCERNCGICKRFVLNKYKDRYQLIYVGDGITDLEALKDGDIIFATGYLAKILKNLHINYNKYVNFYDIKIKLQELL
ncbi:MtnX-like HAD-IB family phosphatase [Persephonella sp.]